jgi:hypothetical protein
MASSSVSEPTLVLYKSSVCRHCIKLSEIWDKPPGKDEDSVVSALKKVHPKLRFYVLTAKDNTGKFDENTAPKDLIRYGKWFPMILLIPGRMWDEAMSKLGPKNEVTLIDGVQIMNGKLENSVPTYVQKHDIRKPAEFAEWLKEALNNEDFKRVQNNPNPASGGNVVVPTIPAAHAPSQPIQPLLTSIIKPTNTSTHYVQSGASEPHGAGDICSMRIISRPK